MSDNSIKKVDKYNYNVKDIIGQGQYGKVFRGVDTKSGEKVAISTERIASRNPNYEKNIK